MRADVDLVADLNAEDDNGHSPERSYLLAYLLT